jgi:transposase
MKRFIEGADRAQVTLLPEYLDDYIAEDNPVRVVDAYVEELNLQGLGFEGCSGRRAAGRRTTRRCFELMWLTGRLAPDFKRRRSMPSTT